MRNIVVFIPSIESGWSRKNLFYIINYIQHQFDNVYLLTADKPKYSNLEKNIKLLSPNSKFYRNKKRFFKSLICFYLIIKYFLNKKILIFSLQSNFFSILASKMINSKNYFEVKYFTRKVFKKCNN